MLKKKFVNPMRVARSMEPGDKALVVFEDFRKMKSFSVMLSEYNAIFGKEKGIFIHSSSKRKILSAYLVAVSYKDRLRELNDESLRDEWRKQIPEEWRRQ